MFEAKIVRRYLNALIGLVSEADFSAVKEQLELIALLVRENEQLDFALSVPILSVEEKFELLKAVEEKITLHPLVRNFLKVLLEADRFALIDEIARNFADFWYQAQDIKKAVVFSVVPLLPEQISRIKENLEKSSGKKFVVQNFINKDLLGGIVIQIGSLHYDFSLQCKINKLRQSVIGEN